ncbi:hypothetical protein ACET3Z_029943 [Daucus carota]
MTLIWHLRRRNSYRRSKLPPGPRGWPVIGNIFDFGTLPHRGLAALKQKYGPVVWLNLGPVKTMVILSAAAAEELFKNHDLSFADRFTNDTMSSRRISETALIRQKCVDEMLLWIEKEVEKGASGGIELTKFIFPASFNLIGNLTVSRDLMNPYSEMASEFQTALSGFSECLGSPNISDLFPWLRWLDLQGLRATTDQNLGKAMQIISGFLDDRVKQRQQKEARAAEHKDFLDVLLDFEGSGKNEPAKLSRHQITIFLMEMFMAGTDTTSATIEWAMCELLQNPEPMKKIKAELVRVVGVNNRLLESDIDNLPYLQATIEETLRLHAPVPLVLPRKATKDTDFMGYKVPKDTQVFVNAWAIGRDEENWEDALCFKPERFLGSSIGYKGQNYEFLPFGAGRRICPGIPLSHHMLPLILGSLLHHFDWKLSENVRSEMKIDMREKMGLAAKKLEPLRAVPTHMTTSS